MSKLVVSAFVSLDGVTQGPGGPDEDREGGFPHGGWSVPFADEDMGAVMLEQFPAIGSLLLGRKTYEIFAAHWPHITDENDPVASKLNAMPKYVASRTLERVEWNNSRLLPIWSDGGVAEAVAELKKSSEGEVHVQGSSDLIRTLQRHDLVDEYRLMIDPVVLGTGKRLFAEGTAPAAMRLVSSRALGSGALYCVYERAGAPGYGNLGLEEYPEKARELKFVGDRAAGG